MLEKYDIKMCFLCEYKHCVCSPVVVLCVPTYSYRQAQATVLEALPLLNRLGVATKRPDDYFAEMAKTDQHMQKVSTSVVRQLNLMCLRKDL